MQVVFADDTQQEKPSRLGAGSFVAIGGVFIEAERVGPLERALDGLCERTGFPPGEQFKWSPARKKDEFMRTLVEHRRIEFYRSVIDLARRFEVSTCVAVADTNYRTARDKSLDHQDDVTALFLERVSYALGQSDGLIVIAKPGGGAKDDEKFLARCFDLIDTGTEYESLRNLPLGVFTAHSRRIRLLQLADLIASCTLARISGESRYSPEIFELILPLFRRGVDRIGGIGVKIHPDLVYANLYYWLFGDKYIPRDNNRRDLPDKNLPFADHPNEPIQTTALRREREGSGSRPAV